MSRDWVVLMLALMFSLSTPGCMSEQEKFYYTLDDEDKESNSDSANDTLFTLTLGDKGGVSMDISELNIVISYDASTYACSTSGTDGDCRVVQIFGEDNSSWEIGETVIVAENGVNICSQSCILSFTINGPEGSKIVGPTILNVS